jgi:8-oxo-dGTP pyrophosphatase MutT (NUDIX family)
LSVFSERLARELRFDPSRFVPLTFRGAQVGWVRPAMAKRLLQWPEVFRDGEIADPDRLPEVLKQLDIPGWRNELYRIADSFDIERAAARPFGLTTQAVHVNGVTRKGMWIARRSGTKAVDPGMLDNLVGGGLTAGLSVEEVLVKEAWEEAGIPAGLARRAIRQTVVKVLREVPEGVQSELIHVHDLLLPEDFVPRNQDGEVAEVKLYSFDAALREVRDTENLTLDAAMVANDYFTRTTS